MTSHYVIMAHATSAGASVMHLRHGPSNRHLRMQMTVLAPCAIATSRMSVTKAGGP